MSSEASHTRRKAAKRRVDSDDEDEHDQRPASPSVPSQRPQTSRAYSMSPLSDDHTRRKSAKRRVDSDNEDEHDQRPASPSVPSQRPQTSRAYSMSPLSDDMEVDVETMEDGDDLPSQNAERRQAPPASLSRRSSYRGAKVEKEDSPSLAQKRTSRPSQRLLDANAAAEPPPRKRAKRIKVDSDDDGEFGDGPKDVDDADGSDEGERPAKTNVKRANSGRGRGRGGRGKAKAEERKITMKDERKSTLTDNSAKRPLEGQAGSAKRPTLRESPDRIKTEDVKQKLEESSTPEAGQGTPSTSETAKPAVPANPARKRLPQIKKNRTGTGTSTPATATPPPTARPNATAATAAAAATSASNTTRPASSAVSNTTNAPLQRKTAITAGVSDLDLSNPDLYKALFAGKSSGTTRATSTRKEKDEDRRRELYKMRDDARAKREAESKHCFDLQASQERIDAFEERLKAARSRALWPNYLGGAMLDRWEWGKQEQERQRADRPREASEGGSQQLDDGRDRDGSAQSGWGSVDNRRSGERESGGQVGGLDQSVTWKS